MPFNLFEYHDMVRPMGVSQVKPPSTQKCPKDTKKCPGGFIVSRTGAKCTFPACPSCAPTYTSKSEKGFTCTYDRI